MRWYLCMVVFGTAIVVIYFDGHHRDVNSGEIKLSEIAGQMHVQFGP